jgi:hypothetical protein
MTPFQRSLHALVGAVVGVIFSGAAVAQPAASPAVPAGADPAASNWRPQAEADVRAGAPFVVRVVVALCDNALIDCGSELAGRPSSLRYNLYWGAIFGAQRFLERKRSQFALLAVQKPGGAILERRIYERLASGQNWGLDAGKKVRQIVVLDAVDGKSIDSAVDSFYQAATGGDAVLLPVSGAKAKVHVVGYVGHNRLMDGRRLPVATRPSVGATPSFVLACESEAYFSPSLKRAGSVPLVTTRALMAPEGYVLAAVLRGLGDGKSRSEIRKGAVLSYANWQKLSYGAASWIFAKH